MLSKKERAKKNADKVIPQKLTFEESLEKDR
jgi:hypothetical protein